ncbi:MAG: DEAD/DEAH box helicase [Clostridia bacterium]|nr:DEAD/DEAH box helicase [Clostridia bacterium]
MNLKDDILTLKGVGEKKAELLNKLNIRTVEDLIYFFPRRYEDRRKPKKVIEAVAGTECLLELLVVSVAVTSKRYGRNSLVKVVCRDDTGFIDLLFFNASYSAKYFKAGETVSIFGRVSENNGRKQISHPEFHKAGSKDDMRGLIPVYPLTFGLTQKTIRGFVSMVKPCFSEIKEWLPADIVESNRLCSPEYAITNIHFPKDERPVLEGRYRLIFEELLTLQTGLFYIKSGIKDESGIAISDIDPEPFISSLKFSLTDGQKKVSEEIRKDLVSGKAMNRLVQGDVGSGKTVVAEIAMFETVKSGFQAVMMAPTEILAKQHFASLKRDFEPFGIKVGMLIGSQTKKEKNAVLQ